MQEQIVVEIDAMSRACEGGLRTQNEKEFRSKFLFICITRRIRRWAGGLEECLSGAGGEEMLQ